MRKFIQKRFDELVSGLVILMEKNPEMTKKEIRNIFLSRRHHAKNYWLIELSYTDLWREAFRPEMDMLIRMAKRVKGQAKDDDSLKSLTWLLESEFALLPNAPRLKEYSSPAMKIVMYEEESDLRKFSISFGSWIKVMENKLKLLSNMKEALQDLSSESGLDSSGFEKMARDYIASISVDEKRRIYERVCGKYLQYYSEKHRGINFAYIAQNKSRISFQGRQIKKSFRIGSYLPPAMLEYLIIEKGGKVEKGKLLEMSNYRKTA